MAHTHTHTHTHTEGGAANLVNLLLYMGMLSQNGSSVFLPEILVTLQTKKTQVIIWDRYGEVCLKNA